MPICGLPVGGEHAFRLMKAGIQATLLEMSYARHDDFLSLAKTAPRLAAVVNGRIIAADAAAAMQRIPHYFQPPTWLEVILPLANDLYFRYLAQSRQKYFAIFHSPCFNATSFLCYDE